MVNGIIRLKRNRHDELATNPAANCLDASFFGKAYEDCQKKILEELRFEKLRLKELKRKREESSSDTGSNDEKKEE